MRGFTACRTALLNFVDQLVSHEFCHQWWYNVVGVNGYAETWMDEGLAVYFSHHLQDLKYGKNNTLVTLPGGLEWLPEHSPRGLPLRHDDRFAGPRRGVAHRPGHAEVQKPHPLDGDDV